MNDQLSSLDVLAAGELLIDFISTDFAESLNDVQDFRRIAGGSPANLAGNLKRLGKNVGLVASVGQDDMGRYLQRFVQELGLNTEGLVREVIDPTTLILVTRSKEVSNFAPYRMADFQISPDQVPSSILDQVRIFHTTCFGLSKEPARSTILSAAHRVADRGAYVSIDANYAQKIWPDQQEAQKVVAEYCQMGALVKFSEVDWHRLYGAPLVSPEPIAEFLHQQGAKIVCLTLGDKGCYVSNGEESHFLAAREIKVLDTTGAGDAFWSGFLCAFLDGYPPLHCAMAGRKMAEIKLGHFGPLSKEVPVEEIYVDFR